MKPIVLVSSVSKTYPRSTRSVGVLINALLRRSETNGFKAIDNISFSAFKGDVIGVIGANGSGKSTLLQIISGTLTQSTGSVVVNGKLSAVLELGSGFDPNFSGKENARIYLNSLRISDQDIKEKIHEIIEFSELEHFADSALRTYSTGMIARLAFSVAVCVDPEILVLDEVFAVGDQAFSIKSFEKIRQFIEDGKTIFLCSHSMYHIQMVCNKALLLKNGKISFFGATKDALVKYEKDLKQTAMYRDKNIGGLIRNSENSSSYKILKVSVLKNGNFLDDFIDIEKVFKSGIDTLSLVIDFKYEHQNKPPQLGVVIHDCKRNPITCAGSHFDKFQYNLLGRGDKIVKISFPKIKLLKGNYEIDIFLLCEKGFLLLDHMTLSPFIQVQQDSSEVGLFLIDHYWEDVGK